MSMRRRPQTYAVINGSAKVGEAKVETLASVMHERNRYREFIERIAEPGFSGIAESVRKDARELLGINY